VSQAMSDNHQAPPTQPPAEATQTDPPIQAQPTPPRQIDENTDLKTLTDEEIKQLNEMAEQSAMKVQDERVSRGDIMSRIGKHHLISCQHVATAACILSHTTLPDQGRI
jgi:hypothetical protein